MKHPLLSALLAVACATPVSALESAAFLPALPQADAAQASDTLPLTGLPSDDPVVDAIWQMGELQVMDHLDELVNGIGPRLTSSTLLTEACEWAVQRFNDWGLENVRMEAWGEIPVGFDRAHLRGRMVQPRKIGFVFTTPAWTPGTDGKVRGAAVIAPRDAEALEAARGTLAGAWVLCPTVRPRFDSDADDYQSALGHFLDAEGIAGTISGSRGELVRTSGRRPASAEELETRVSISLRRDQLGEVPEMIEAGEDVVLEFDIAQEFVEGPIPVYNVLAEIPGTDLADEIVIIGGHIDSWDGAGGAQDNGTGTSTTMEAARVLAQVLRERGLQPRRTIRFMLWSGEEQGLLGSRAYIAQHPEENERISAVLVHDGGTNACAGIVATPAMLPLFEEVFAPVIAHTADNPDEDLRFFVRPVEYLPVGIGSDHDAYLRVDPPVPGFFWQQRGRTNYTYIHHTQHDWIDQVAPDYQDFTARVVASSAWRVANMDQMVPRDDMIDPNRGRRGQVANRRTLGVNLGDGLALAAVSDGGLAAMAGMKAGDVLVSIGGAKLADVAALRGAMRGGAARKLVVWKRGDTMHAAWFDWEKRSAEKAEVPDQASTGSDGR
jgi:hypothetical protein